MAQNRRHIAFTVAISICAAMTASSLNAQARENLPGASLNDSNPKMCFRGQSKPACDLFMLMESSVEQLMFAAPGKFVVPAGQGYPQFVLDRRPTRTRLTIEIGMMANIGQRNALGASLFAGNGGPSARVGAKLRYRRWLTTKGLAIDVGAGTAFTEDQWTRTTVFNPVGDLAINMADYGALTTGITTRQMRSKHLGMVYGGARLGSKPGIAGVSILAILGTLTVIAMFATST